MASHTLPEMPTHRPLTLISLVFVAAAAVATAKPKDPFTYRHQGNGTAGPDGSACSYVAPVRKIQLKMGAVADYEFYLTIGTLNEIRARFEKIPGKP